MGELRLEYVTEGTILLVLLVFLTLEGLVEEQNSEGSFDNLYTGVKPMDRTVVRRQHRYMGGEHQSNKNRPVNYVQQQPPQQTSEVQDMSN